MDQKQLIVVAKQQQGLTSDYALAQRLGITRSRMSLLNSGGLPADEAEIFMLAEMAKIDPRVAAAAVKQGREKNPAKRAYWEKITMQFASFLIAVLLGFAGFSSEVNASEMRVSKSDLSTNYAKLSWLVHECEVNPSLDVYANNSFVVHISYSAWLRRKVFIPQISSLH